MTMVVTAPSGAPRAAPAAEEVIACHECGTVHRLPPMADDTVAKCVTCGARIVIRFERSIERTLALYLAALILFVVANAFPILTHVDRRPSQCKHRAGRCQGALRRRDVAAGAGRGTGRHGAATGQDPRHAGDPGAAAARLAAAMDRERLSLGRAAAALVDDGSLPAGRDRRLCEAAGPGHGPSGHRHAGVRRHDSADGRRRRPLRAARDLAPPGAAGRPRGAGGSARDHAAGLRAVRPGRSRRFRRTCMASSARAAPRRSTIASPTASTAAGPWR